MWPELKTILTSKMTDRISLLPYYLYLPGQPRPSQTIVILTDYIPYLNDREDKTEPSPRREE